MKNIRARERIISKLQAGLDEINQIFLDAEYWNNSVRKPEQEKIDPDPKGELAEWKAKITALLKNEEIRS